MEIMDAILYALIGMVTAVVVAVPFYSLCLGAEWLYEHNQKFKSIIDKWA